MAYISTIISGAASLGVLIGLISGIFFLVLTALRWVCRVRASLYEEELRRQKKFFINNSYSAGDDDPDFRETKKTENGFACTLEENNVQEKINQCFQNKPEGATQRREPETNLNGSEKEDPNFDTVKVRELIEKMVETMIGGPLDGTTVGQMSTHSSYLGLFTKYHNLLCRELARLGFALHLSVVRKNAFEVDPTDIKQKNLKRLIKRIVSEAIALPDIKNNLCLSKASNKVENEDFKNKSYEDILATAILNKVIDNFQNKNNGEKQKKDGKPKPKLRNKKVRKTDDKSEDDWSDTSRSDQLSLTIEEYIEEITTTVEASDSDAESDFSDFETISNRRIPFPESGKTVVDGKRTVGADDENSDSEEQNTATELVTSTSSWEDNWLFQKKRLRSTPNAHHPVPVPMLVPNPSEDFRALVGGVDADDLSDMSDCNDTVLEDLITTKKKNYEQKLGTDCESRKTLDVAAEELKETQNHPRVDFPRENKEIDISNSEIPNTNEKKCDETLKEDEKYNCSESSEHGKNLPSLNSSEVLSQKDRDSSIENFSHQYEAINSLSPSEGAIQISITTESEDCQMICPLAEKEKEKWMNPIQLVDNPYSLENINKREQRKKNEYFRIGTYTGESVEFPENLSSEEFSKREIEKLRFSRDYYVNASKQPSGMTSPRFDERSEEYDQKSVKRNMEVTVPESNDKLLVKKIQDKQNNKNSKCQIVDRSQFSLPSVKELAKQFAIEDCTKLKSQNDGLQTKLESKHKTLILTTSEIPEKEPEIDYSPVPVSEIILNLQQIAEDPARECHRTPVIYNHTPPTTRMEICRKVDNNSIIEHHTENAKKTDKIEAVRFNGKQVHSLTARSISKEFREGLKNNSYQKICLKINRISSSGESDQGSIVSNKTKTSPTPSIDLKNMKKFWEEIITANSNATKQK